MMIYFDKQTGEVTGFLEGRVHDEIHLNSWAGDRTKIDRIVCNWKLTATWVDADGDGRQDFEPDHFQKEIMIELDKHPMKAYAYKVDLKTKTLILK